MRGRGLTTCTGHGLVTARFGLVCVSEVFGRAEPWAYEAVSTRRCEPHGPSLALHESDPALPRWSA